MTGIVQRSAWTCRDKRETPLEMREFERFLFSQIFMHDRRQNVWITIFVRIYYAKNSTKWQKI